MAETSGVLNTDLPRTFGASGPPLADPVGARTGYVHEVVNVQTHQWRSHDVREVDLLRAAQSGAMCGGDQLVRSAVADGA
eukprot:scaffold83085_cov30-Phaeocystis_antarctica.AAC.1